ncbi:glycogen debranching enzyme, partial [Mycolicibacterium elephantis]
QIRDIAWLTPAGEEMTLEDWEHGLGKCVAVFLNGDAITTPNARGERVIDDSFLLCFNANDQPQDFITPAGDYAAQWTAALDTANPTGASDLVVQAGEKISLQARSLLVMRKTA